MTTAHRGLFCRHLPILVCALLLCLPAEARGRRPYRLSLTMGPGTGACPDARWFKSEIASRTGVDPWKESAGQVIHLHVEATAGTFRASFRIQRQDGSGTGARNTVERDCRDLLEKVASYLSDVIHPPAVPLARPASPPRPAPPPRALKGPPPQERARPSVAASVGGQAVFGAAPGIVSGGLTAQVRLKWTFVSLALEGRVDPPRFDAADVGEVGTALYLGGMVPCLHYGWFGGCGVIMAGAIYSEGRGRPNPQAHTDHYLAGGLRAQAEFPLASILSLRVHGDLLFPVWHLELQDSGTGQTVWEMPAVSGSVGVSLVGTFYHGSK